MLKRLTSQVEQGQSAFACVGLDRPEKKFTPHTLQLPDECAHHTSDFSGFCGLGGLAAGVEGTLLSGHGHLT
jgi:hypothetical protein